MTGNTTKMIIFHYLYSRSINSWFIFRYNPTTKAVCSAPCRIPINLISSVHEGVDNIVVPHGFNVTIVGDGGRVYVI